MKQKYNENDFYTFLQSVFKYLEQGQDFQPNWHIELIAEYLTEVYNGNIKRLIITMPPRYLKSLSVSVAFPAWVMGQSPKKRIIVASYSQGLSLKHSSDCRFILHSDWFKEQFKECEIAKGENRRNKFITTKHGFRFATSIGATLTGEGGDILIVDDPHNPQQILSPIFREKVQTWFCNTFISRLNNKKEGAIIIVMQRLHQDDLVGFLTNKRDDWKVLNIPAIADADIEYKIGNFQHLYKKGDILHHDREDEKEIEKMRKDMGSYVFSAQYLQKPVIECGNYIKKEWLQKTNIKNINIQNYFLSFDTALKDGANNDPSVCTIWGHSDNKAYLIEVVRKWLEYPDLKKEAISLITKWKPIATLIEDKSSGQSLIQELKREGKLGILPMKVKGDKKVRLASVSPLFEAKNIFLPEEADWLVEYENELCSFPQCKHDDQVDSTTQFLEWWRNKYSINEVARIRRL
ncbi:MAG: phage terminase large subunit [Rickettsiales bacterium]|nr:MAG: phage terminase large subunit [Rickettsiales bacterium]